MLAIPWFFINEAGQHGLFGVLYAAITGVSLFWMLYSGTLIDRFDRKHIFMGINAAGALVLLGLATTGFINGSVSVPLAIVAFATTFFIYNIHFPNLYAFAQEITQPKHYGRIVSWLEIQHQLTSAIAGAIGALLLAGVDVTSVEIGGTTLNLNLHIAPWPLERIFLLDGCTYILAFILIGLIRYASIAKKSIDRGSIRERLQIGVDYLKSHPNLFLFGTVSYAVFISVLVAIYFLVPGYVETQLGQSIESFSLLKFFYSGGCVIAGIFVTRLFQNVPRVLTVIILGFLAMGFYWIGLFNTSLSVFFGLGLVLGIANAGTRIMRASYIFSHVPNSVIGRVTSIFNIYHIVFRLTFILLFSLPFFSGASVINAFIVLGSFILLSMIILIARYRQIRNA